MPTYDYECDACKHALEIFQGINDPIKRKCPECGRMKLRRLIGTGGGLVFKGSGFYKTDYRSDSYEKAAKADQKTTSTSKSDAKDKSKASGGKKASKKGDSK
jgi:putative FmdB family regulatory protein